MFGMKKLCEDLRFEIAMRDAEAVHARRMRLTLQVDVDFLQSRVRELERDAMRGDDRMGDVERHVDQIPDKLAAIEARIPVPCAVCGKGLVPNKENTVHESATFQLMLESWGCKYRPVCVHTACRKGTEYDRRAKKRKGKKGGKG